WLPSRDVLLGTLTRNPCTNLTDLDRTSKRLPEPAELRMRSTDMRRLHLIGIALVAATLVFTSDAAGKEFKPGDLRLCSANRCVTIRDQQSLNMLASFGYTRRRPAETRAPRLGAPYFRSAS